MADEVIRVEGLTHRFDELVAVGRGLVLGRGRRGLLVPRPERRGQVDRDQRPDHAPADAGGRGRDRGPRPPDRARPGPRGDRDRLPGGDPRPRHDRGRDPRVPRAALRPSARGAAEPDRRTGRARRARGQARHPDQVPLGRDEAAPGDRARPDDPPDRPLPRRADDRARPPDAGPDVGLPPAGQPGGDHDLSHDPLHGRGRPALEPDRDHRLRPDRRRGPAVPAQERARPGPRSTWRRPTTPGRGPCSTAPRTWARSTRRAAASS